MMDSEGKYWISFWALVFGFILMMELFNVAGKVGIERAKATVEMAKLKDCV